MTKNKYADMNMIDLKDKSCIAGIFIDCLYNTDKTVAVIADKELVAYVMGEVLELDDTSVKTVYFSDKDISDEYFISVDDDGCVIFMPIENYDYLKNVDAVYIDMDGSVSQETIDFCVNEDKCVTLFGQTDDCDKNDREFQDCCSHDETYLYISEDKDGDTHGFTASKSDGDSYMSYSFYSSEELSHEDIQKMLKAFGF